MLGLVTRVRLGSQVRGWVLLLPLLEFLPPDYQPLMAHCLEAVKHLGKSTKSGVEELARLPCV
jgi:hypothetical protein